GNFLCSIPGSILYSDVPYFLFIPLGPFCEEPADPCASETCLNGGICQYNQSGYVCDCPAGFLGHNCEFNINECSSKPCQNRGTCIDLPNSSKIHWCICSCMPGSTGKNCEEVIDYCRLLSINCLNEGLCSNTIGGFTDFFYPPGEFCELQVDNCGSNSCENGGTCVNYEDHYKCTCPIGFEGERCELDIDACLLYNISCDPGALCMDKSHGFNYTCSCFYDEENQKSHCVCALGWTGQTCLENINDCEINQCQHESTCEDGINKYRCICPLGYTGVFCELDIDNCIGNQCSEYGVCQDHLNNYSCHCMLGYEGQFCEVEINECSSFPCKNGATCVNLIGRFSCHCAAGFKGKF
ncbi:FBP1 protein, partial [Nothocercus julius]|nr:FBP1 protein [Nothocercus julius]